MAASTPTLRMPADRAVPLRHALLAMVYHPGSLLAEWNWKAGAVSGILHGLIFFVVNLRAGSSAATKAMVVEAVYSILTAGLAGTVTQRLRHAVPQVATAMVVWIALSVALLLGRLCVHVAMGTPKLRGSLAASFVFAALASGFNWFAMSRGAFITGEGRSFARDLLLVPKLIWQFLAWPVRQVLALRR